MTDRVFTEPQYVLDGRQQRAMARRPQPCGAGVGRGLTCGKYPASLYPRGHRCADCATAEGLVVGQAPGAYPELLRDRRAAGQYRTASLPTVSDQRAESSGKRDPNRKARRDADTLHDRFLTFHQHNGHVMERLVELVGQHVTRGATRLGIGALFEELRGDVETNGNAYRLDNSLRSLYVRALVAQHPEWAHLFELRERKTA